jgi:hypothetical protein
MTTNKNLENQGFYMPYLAERFESAVSALVGEGSVKDRLDTAYTEYLDDLESEELPQEQDMRVSFEDLQTALHAVSPTGREPCVRATIRKMSTLQAGSHARTIVSLYAELVCHGERTKLLKLVNGKFEKASNLVVQGL